MSILLAFRSCLVSKRLEVLMFGGLRLRAGDQETAHFRTQKTAALLAYLALFPDRPHRRETLMELLWPDCLPSAARQSLSTALWALRQQLAALFPGEDGLLQTDRTTVSLSRGELRTDVGAFQEALKKAQDAAGRDEQLTHLAEAVRLYQGALLDGLYEDWVFAEQSRMAAHYQQALADLCRAHEAAGDPSAALEYAALAVEESPLSSAHRHRLVRLYAEVGQPSVALAHYREFERLARRELGQAPDAALRSLAEQISAQSASEVVGQPTAAAEHSRAPGKDPPPEPEASTPYVERQADREFSAAIGRRSSIVLVKGPRGTGKTSLLIRGLGLAREEGLRVVFTDLQALAADQLETGDTLLRALANSLAEQLELEALPADSWVADWAPSLNLRRYLRRQVLEGADQHIVWALDEVDRLFTRPFYGDVFGLFRSWHNERASDPEGLWSRLTLVLAYSTEAHLFIRDLDQSPFNVGVRMDLEDLTAPELAELNRRMGNPLASEAELERFRARFGGHPYLAQRALRELVQGRADLAALETSHHAFRDHLRDTLAALRQDPELCTAVQHLLRGEGRLSEDSVMRLRNAGLITQDRSGAVRFRCGLYRDYLSLYLA